MDDSIQEKLISTIAAKPGITLVELLGSVDGAQNYQVYELILTGQIYTDLYAAWLGDEERVLLFRDRLTATFFTRLTETQERDNSECPQAADLQPGTTFRLDGTPFELFNVGKTEVILKSAEGDFPRMEINKFEKFLREGVITDYTLRPQFNPDAKAYELAERRRLTPEQMLETLERYDVVKKILAGERVAANDNEARKFRYWVSDYKKAEAEYGNGFVGLMPKNRKGNTTDRLALIHPDLRQMMIKFIATLVETTTKITKSIVYGEFRLLCKRKNITPPCYKTFDVEIERRKGAEQTEKMEGSKAAYQQEEFVDDKYYTTPVHGDRPWEYAHLDHTEMDIKLRHSRKSKKRFRRKAWLTLLIDACTRRVLAHHISFEKPSRVSCMMVVRDCVRRHGRLPDCIVVDNGPEFVSEYFEKLLSRYYCDTQWRPPTKPRFGAIIERFLHTLNKQFLHNLLGNTKIMKKARQVTKAVDPDTHAIWTLPLLDEALEKYFYHEYDTREHSALGQSPREEFDELMEKYNAPAPVEIKYDQIFLIETMVPVRNGTLKVQRSRGVKVFGTWYKAPELRDSSVIGKKVRVNIDPDDVSHVYAFVKNHWVECLAPPRIFSLLRGKSVRLMKIISEEERELFKSYAHGANTRFEDLALRHEAREETEREELQRLIDEESSEMAARKGALRLVDAIAEAQDSKRRKEDDDQFVTEINLDKLETFKRARRG